MQRSLTPSNVPRPPSRSAQKTTFLHLKRASTPYLFILPFYLLFICFIIVPLFYAGSISLYADRLVGGTVFVGLQNYTQVLHDANFWSGIQHMLLLGVIQIPVMLGLALLFALLMNTGTTALRSLFRLGFFLPYAIPSVVAALIWGYLYGPSFGLFTQIFHLLHLPALNLLAPQWVLTSIGNIITWQYTGYNMIIIYAALQSISPELIESAQVDGATGLRIALLIKIPLVMPALLLTGIFSIIGTLQLFNEPQILSTLAPTVIGDHYTPSLYAYNAAFSNQQFNYSAAISFMLALVAFICSAIFMFIASRRRNTNE